MFIENNKMVSEREKITLSKCPTSVNSFLVKFRSETERKKENDYFDLRNDLGRSCEGIEFRNLSAPKESCKMKKSTDQGRQLHRSYANNEFLTQYSARLHYRMSESGLVLQKKSNIIRKSLSQSEGINKSFLSPSFELTINSLEEKKIHSTLKDVSQIRTKDNSLLLSGHSAESYIELMQKKGKLEARGPFPKLRSQINGSGEKKCGRLKEQGKLPKLFGEDFELVNGLVVLSNDRNRDPKQRLSMKRWNKKVERVLVSPQA